MSRFWIWFHPKVWQMISVQPYLATFLLYWIIIFLEKLETRVPGSVPANSLSEEINPQCRQVIMDHHSWCGKVTGSSHSMPCLFGDVVKCVPPGSFNDADPFWKKLFAIDRADIMMSQHCFTCNTECPIEGNAAATDFEVAGLPCVDQSKCGHQKFENGRTAKVFMAHAKLHAHKCTPLIILENVQEKITWDTWSDTRSNTSCRFPFMGLLWFVIYICQPQKMYCKYLWIIYI